MDDFNIYDTVEGWALEYADQVVYSDDDDIHHIEVYDIDESSTDIIGSGYCHDHDDTCHYQFGEFEEVSLWTFTQ